MPDYNDILSQLYEILAPYTNVQDALKEDTDLVAGLGLSSLKIMEMLLDIEDGFDVSVPLNSLPDIRTIGDLARQLQLLQGQG